MILVVGLGNPGKEYAATRHNVGFMVVDRFAEEHGIMVEKSKFKSLIGEGHVGTEKIILAKPQTYMNLSGEAVLDIVNFYKIPPENVIVIVDDMDLPAGKVRLRVKGGSGGHNGLKSIIYQLQTEDFPRLRIGIGKPAPERQAVGFVLGRFSDEEKELTQEAINKAAAAIKEIIKSGAERAMNRVNINT
ncbi:MAG: aminoacyl-tRNA hydrolase [Bacillota bacterium]